MQIVKCASNLIKVIVEFRNASEYWRHGDIWMIFVSLEVSLDAEVARGETMEVRKQINKRVRKRVNGPCNTFPVPRWGKEDFSRGSKEQRGSSVAMQSD